MTGTRNKTDDVLSEYMDAKTTLTSLLALFKNAPEFLLRPGIEQALLDAIARMKATANAARAVAMGQLIATPRQEAPELLAGVMKPEPPTVSATPPKPTEAPEPNLQSNKELSPGVEVLCFDVPDVLEILVGNLDRALSLDSIQRLERACCEARLRQFDFLDARTRKLFYSYVVAQCLALQDLASPVDERMLRPRITKLFSSIKNHIEGIFIHGMAKNHAPKHRSWAEDMNTYRRQLERVLGGQQKVKSPSSKTSRDVTVANDSGVESCDERSQDLCAGLSALAARYPDTLVVLPAAYHSAADACDFVQTERALDLMERLVVDYLPLLDGGGDAQARSVFTQSEYSANESETTRASKRAMELRTFEYEGEQIAFLRHLRIGTSPSSREGWRCHFHHGATRNRIVIGHCGAHLDLK